MLKATKVRCSPGKGGKKRREKRGRNTGSSSADRGEQKKEGGSAAAVAAEAILNSDCAFDFDKDMEEQKYTLLASELLALDLNRLKGLDVYTKTRKEAQSSGAGGGLVTIVVFTVMALLLLGELRDYLSPQVRAFFLPPFRLFPSHLSPAL